MTVFELIEELGKFQGDSIVVVDDDIVGFATVAEVTRLDERFGDDAGKVHIRQQLRMI